MHSTPFLRTGVKSNNCKSIVFVHGLQGHPRQTWTSVSPSPPSRALPPARLNNESPSKKIWRIFSRSKRDTLAVKDEAPGDARGKLASDVFWPHDLLPADCPQAQIFTWGYDTDVTKGFKTANHDSLFSHAKNLLAALERERQVGRPLIFVAHSLGGIVVKEVTLFRS